jgi:cell division protein FtsB
MHDGNLRFVRGLRTLFESQNTARRRLVWGVALAALLLVVLFVIGGNYGLLNILRLREERRVLQTQIRELEGARDSLKLLITKLKYDKKEIERVARETYGMARPGEQIIKFVDPQDTGRH